MIPKHFEYFQIKNIDIILQKDQSKLMVFCMGKTQLIQSLNPTSDSPSLIILKETALHSKIMPARKFENVDILYLAFQFVKSNQFRKMAMYKDL